MHVAGIARPEGVHLETIVLNDLRVWAADDASRPTLHYWRGGRTAEEIAHLRDVKPSTIYGHLADAVDAGETVDLSRVLTPDQQTRAAKAFYQFGWANIPGALESLGSGFDYGQLKVFRAVKNRDGR